MFNKEQKLGALIVPTGVGASVGGFAGDASLCAKKISEKCKLIVNPNVVNAACFSGINDNMFYVEGYSLDEFFKGNLSLIPSYGNKIGIVFDKSIPNDILNVHINTINAVKTVYGIDVVGYEITDEDVGVSIVIDKSGISTGNVDNLKTIKFAAEKLIKNGAEAIAIVCLFPEDDNDNDNYAKGIGVDPVGGVEAIISHYISKELKVPCAHAPAFCNYDISTAIVDSRCSAEYITPTFLPCILIGLNNAPKISNKDDGININNLDFLIMPYDSVGGVPVFESLKRDIKIYTVSENTTVLDVTSENLNINSVTVQSYSQLAELL